MTALEEYQDLLVEAKKLRDSGLEDSVEEEALLEQMDVVWHRMTPAEIEALKTPPLKNEMMFFGSCGHVTIEEISNRQFEKYTTTKGYTGMAEVAPCTFRVGRTRRRVYVYPGRYCECQDCFKTTMMEM